MEITATEVAEMLQRLGPTVLAFILATTPGIVRRWAEDGGLIIPRRAAGRLRYAYVALWVLALRGADDDEAAVWFVTTGPDGRSPARDLRERGAEGGLAVLAAALGGLTGPVRADVLAYVAGTKALQHSDSGPLGQ